MSSTTKTATKTDSCKSLSCRSGAMNDQAGEILEAQEESGGARRTTGREHPEGVMERIRQRKLQGGQEEPNRGMQQCWDTQWQQFLGTLQTPHSASEISPVSNPTPWDDAKAFLASFEQVAAACQWPRGEWVARLMPALSEEALQAFSLLEARDKEDYGKVKATILRYEALRREVQRQHFRQFCWQELEDPRKTYVQIQALCCQWLKPERHSKEQILELLVLEQFLASLPEEAQSWVRAGGPDSCAQAVALLEDFLRTQREDETGTWQEPLQEWNVVVLGTKEECLDLVQGEISKEPSGIFSETKQNVDGEVSVPGIGIAHPTSLLPEGQAISEAELNKALGVSVDQVMDPKKMGLSLHMVEQTTTDTSQQTMFWKVLQEDHENMDPLDNEKVNQLKMTNAPVGGNEPMETSRSGQGKTQENVLVRVEMMDERCESNSRHGIDPLMGCQESGELTESLRAACSNPIPVDAEGKMALFSKYRREENEHQRSQMEMKNYECLELEVELPFHSSAKHHVIHTREQTYKCADCGKRSSERSHVLSHQMIHTGQKSYQCPEGEKKFSQTSTFLTNRMMHAGETPHKCPKCGKNFSQRSTLVRHEKVHTGEKPHKCPECGKGFAQRSTLLTHQMIHTGEKPHKCAKCGKNFAHKSNLLRHETFHIGKKPHPCPECGKSFSRRSNLLIHQMVHTGEKPHKCNACGKSFCHRSHLLRHEMIHTGKKPHQCRDCGKRFSRRSHLLRHETTHTRENSQISSLGDTNLSQR